MGNCRICGKSFYTKPSWLKKGFGFLCSRTCQNEWSRTGKVVNCFLCREKVYKSLKALKKSKKYFCNKSCQTKWRNTFFSGSKHANWKDGASIAYRNIMIKNDIPKICSLCRSVDFRILAVHHIDLNHNNNSLKNLMWLCHNCHFLIHHYNEERDKLMVPIA